MLKTLSFSHFCNLTPSKHTCFLSCLYSWTIFVSFRIFKIAILNTIHCLINSLLQNLDIVKVDLKNCFFFHKVYTVWVVLYYLILGFSQIFLPTVHIFIYLSTLYNLCLTLYSFFFLTNFSPGGNPSYNSKVLYVSSPTIQLLERNIILLLVQLLRLLTHS